MPKKYIFYALGVLLLAVVGMYGYTKWTEAKEKVNLWTLIPEDAVFVLETSNHGKLLQKLRQSELWDDIASVRSVEALTENITLLDSLSRRKNGASRFLKRKNVLTSVHVVSKTDFDYVFYIPVNTVGEHRFVRTLVENITKSPAFNETTQEYQEYLISTITNVTNNDTFSYFSFHNNLIVSANPELLKEIIRKINRGQLTSPAEEYETINYLTQPEIFAHVYINYRHLPPFLHVFLKDDLKADITYLASLCRSSKLGLKQQRGAIFLNGFSNPEPLAQSFYNRIKDQPPQSFTLKHYMPTRTALLVALGLNRVTAVKHLNPPDRLLSRPAGEVLLMDSLARTLRHELGIAYLVSEKEKASTEKLIFVQSANPTKTTSILNTLIRLSAVNTAQKPVVDNYNNFSLKKLPVPQLPVLLFGSVARGYAECYAVQVDNYLIFGPDAAALRQVLADIQAGRVWSKDSQQKVFLEQTQQEANFSTYINTRLAWSMLKQQVREPLLSSLLRHETLIKHFNQVAIQFSRQEDQYYTSLLVTHPAVADTVREAEAVYQIKYHQAFDNPLISSPYAVDFATETGPQLLVQDSALVLHAVDARGAVLWDTPLDQKVISPITPLVLGSKPAANYLFATANSIHCLQPDGREIENFPFTLSDSLQIQRLTLLRDKQNNYRLLLDDPAGRLLLLDLKGNLQPGWDPKQLASPLAAAPRYYQLNGREIIVALLQNGFIYAFNLRGEVYPGFPIAVEEPLASEVFTKTGTSFRSTQLTTVTTGGQLVTFNLTGQFVQRKQLPTGRRQSVFELVPDPQGQSYIIVRQSPGKVSLFDQNQKLLLEKNFITSSRKLVQYFNFGPLHRIYALTETGPQKSYLYTYRARLIGQPITNELPLAMEFNPKTGSYTLFSSFGTELRKMVFRDE